MFTIKTLQPGESERWDRFVCAHAFGSIYHTAAWRDAVEKTYGHQPLYLYLENRDRDIVAGLPLFAIKNKLTGNRLVSLPAAECCNPLVSNQEQYARLVNHALSYAKQRGLASIELKMNEHFHLNSRGFGSETNGYSTYILDLSDEPEVLLRSFHKSSIQRQIKKAQKYDLELVIGSSSDDVKLFYSLFLRLRKHYGLLPQPFKFFANLWHLLRPKGAIEILHARYQGEIVSSLLLLKYKNTVSYEYGASQFDKRNIGASPFLIWRAIKQARQDGFKKFDFGRTADDNAGLAQFKRRWGARRERLRYCYFPDLSGEARFRKNGLSKRLMAYSMHTLPASMCQWAGSVLYRNFV